MYVEGDFCRDDCLRVPCGQPKTPKGDGPVASDALFVLSAGVGIFPCDLRVCDTNDSGHTSATDALAVLISAVGGGAELICPL